MYDNAMAMWKRIRRAELQPSEYDFALMIEMCGREQQVPGLFSCIH
jgi:hypothetical protein